jgi:ANTAR domain
VIEFCAGEVIRADQMVAMVQYRRVIEQAKGLVMGAAGGHAGTAFKTLVRGSQHFNVKLSELATALVELVGNAPVTEQEPTDSATTTPPGATARHAAEQVWRAVQRGR